MLTASISMSVSRGGDLWGDRRPSMLQQEPHRGALADGQVLLSTWESGRDDA